MSGIQTRTRYDGCAFLQDVKQSTDPLELIMDPTKYINCNNICQPNSQYSANVLPRVDIESALWNLDKVETRCDIGKYPFCNTSGCLLSNDPRIPPNINPIGCLWNRIDDPNKAVITSNMRRATNAGYTIPDTNVCTQQGNGYYINPALPPTGPPAPVGPRQPYIRDCNIVGPVPVNRKTAY